MQSKETGKKLSKIICNKSESNQNIEKYLNYTFNKGDVRKSQKLVSSSKYVCIYLYIQYTYNIYICVCIRKLTNKGNGCLVVKSTYCSCKGLVLSTSPEMATSSHL